MRGRPTDGSRSPRAPCRKVWSRRCDARSTAAGNTFAVRQDLPRRLRSIPRFCECPGLRLGARRDQPSNPRRPAERLHCQRVVSGRTQSRQTDAQRARRGPRHARASTRRLLASFYLSRQTTIRGSDAREVSVCGGRMLDAGRFESVRIPIANSIGNRARPASAGRSKKRCAAHGLSGAPAERNRG